jgi:hypothetical protein
MTMRPLATLTAAALLAAAPAAADPKPDYLEAHALIGRWLDAQNARKFDDYIALYAPDFTGVKRTAADKETRLDLAGWKADRAKMFKAKSLSVEAFAEQYGPEPNGDVTVGFRQVFKSGGYADQGLKMVTMGRRNGKLSIVKEEINAVKKLDPGVVVTIAAGEDVAPALPPDFAAKARFEWHPCKKPACDAELILGDGPSAKHVPMGAFSSNAEGEFTGDDQIRVRGFPLVPLPPFQGAAFVLADAILRDDPKTLNGRYAAIVAKAPAHGVFWSGPLATDKGVPCRAALLPDADKTPVLLHTCGGRRTQLKLQGGAFK